MADKPILFSAPMVRAILDGAKTQTRRVVKWRGVKPGLNMAFSGLAANKGCHDWFLLSRGPGACWQDLSEGTPCPYGEPGDRLWVRETWRERDPDQDGRTLDYRADHEPGEDPCVVPWRPSIHMPRWASRITLELIDVRVERLRDISQADALAEGISEFVGGWWCKYDDDLQQAGATPQEGYLHLWERINGAGSWGVNPWVWVVEFRRSNVRANLPP